MSDSDLDAPDARFSAFVYFQAQNGGLFLGRLPNPATGETMVNLKAAQSVIDALEMLEDKSRGNLNQAEKKLLKLALDNLRQLFEEVSTNHPEE